MLRQWTLLTLLVWLSYGATAQQRPEEMRTSLEEEFKPLRSWVEGLGGWAKVQLGISGTGLRGLFATEDIPAGGHIWKIPGTAVLNVAMGIRSFVVPPLLVLREMTDPHSRFKPYMDLMPKEGEVVNACNFPAEFVPMLQSPYWENQVNSWQEALRDLYDGRINAYADFNLLEAVGTANVTFGQLQHACALAISRYLVGGAHRPNVYLMVPIFDLANHRLGCPHDMVMHPDNEPYGVMVAGAHISKGQEVCSNYGDFRNDHSTVVYGFQLPASEDDRLYSVDHPWFDDGEGGHGNVTDDSALPAHDAVTEGMSIAALDEEARRLRDRAQRLLDTAPRADLLHPREAGLRRRAYNILNAYHDRRILALVREAKRMEGAAARRREAARAAAAAEATASSDRSEL